jgi:hypothetical protein
MEKKVRKYKKKYLPRENCLSWNKLSCQDLNIDLRSLWLSCLIQSIRDLKLKPKTKKNISAKIKKQSLEFLKSYFCEFICLALDINHNFIKALVKEHEINSDKAADLLREKTYHINSNYRVRLPYKYNRGKRGPYRKTRERETKETEKTNEFENLNLKSSILFNKNKKKCKKRFFIFVLNSLLYHYKKNKSNIWNR